MSQCQLHAEPVSLKVWPHAEAGYVIADVPGGA